MRRITVFIANDGSTHRSARACERHEAVCALQPDVEAFLDSIKSVAPSRRRTDSQLIARWETFKAFAPNPFGTVCGQRSDCGEIEAANSSEWRDV